ncbi:MAG: hypothetical protein F4X56_02240 [Gammaproteobacteria bacterium]|nr:hypothetical protein [Gammaproteobacteria bacterium]
MTVPAAAWALRTGACRSETTSVLDESGAGRVAAGVVVGVAVGAGIAVGVGVAVGAGVGDSGAAVGVKAGVRVAVGVVGVACAPGTVAERCWDQGPGWFAVLRARMR